MSSNLKAGASAADAQNAYWTKINAALSKCGVGSLANYSDLVRATSQLDNYGPGVFGSLAEILLDSFLGFWSNPDYLIMYDSSLSVYRPYDNVAHLWVVNSMGHFPYYTDESSDGNAPAYEYQWLKYDQITGFQAGTAIYEIIPYSMLQEVQSVYGSESSIEAQGNYFYICRTPVRSGYYLCTMDGHPVVSIRSLNDTALNTPLDYNTSPGGTTSDGDTIYNEGDTQNSLIISAGENLFWMPDGTLQYIDHLTYDGSTKTYTVDSHDSYTWNETTNNYLWLS